MEFNIIWLVPRVEAHKKIKRAFNCECVLVLVLITLTPEARLLLLSYTMLCAALFIVGNFSGLTDIAMNTLVSKMEKTDSVNIMSAAHGFFSLGGAIGALVGTVLMTIFETPFYHMLLIAIVVIVTNLVLAGFYYKINEVEEENKEKGKLPMKVFKPLFILAFLAMITMGNEGAIEHWSSIYLLEVVEVASENYAGFGFTVFSIMMTIGRFFGDGISAKIGSAKIVFLGFLMASLGYLAVLSAGLVLSLIGFGIIGLGLSVIIPELIRMAGKTEGIPTSKSISFVTGIGFLGFLLGPIVIGYISDGFTLHMSFIFSLIITVIALLFSMYKLRTK